jgi:hypothetical protein
MEIGGEVRTSTIARAYVGTQPVAYHLRVSVARFKMKGTYMMSFAIETHATGSRIVTKNKITSSVNDTMRGTMIIMALTMTSPTNIVLRLEDTMKRESSLSLMI